MTELDPDVALFVSIAAERLADAVVSLTEARRAVGDAAELLATIGVAAPYLGLTMAEALSTHAEQLFDWAHDLGRLSGPLPASESD